MAWIRRLGRSALHAHFEAQRQRSLGPLAIALTAIATYRQDQWEAVLATAADRDTYIARNYLLRVSASILQDDSGIPLRNFIPEKWVLRFFADICDAEVKSQKT